MKFRRAFLTVAALALALIELSAQLRVAPVSEEGGATALGLLLRRLNTVGVFMQATAHPDDETNALHVLLDRGEGIRTILATATRGDGGQNEIGSELFDALAVLRTEELLAIHRFDGTEQYFTRAVDFGYSFSIEETFDKWGRDEIISDYVRLIRMTRPDVIVGLNPTGTAGGLHHQASGVLSREAFKAAADPARYPEQIKEGLRPWQAKKYYYTGPGGGGGRGGGPPLGMHVTTLDTSRFDPLLGRTYAELGAEARSMHKSQGMAQLLALPGPAIARFNLMDSLVGVPSGGESSLFDGIDTTIPSLARFVQGQPSLALLEELHNIAGLAADAKKQFETGGTFAAAPQIVAGLGAVRLLREHLNRITLTDGARYEIDTRLKTKEEQFAEAAVLAHGIRLEVLADDGVVVPGQRVRVSVIIGDRGPHTVDVKSVRFGGLVGASACMPVAMKTGAVFRCDADLPIPADAKPTAPYWKRLPDVARYAFEPDVPFGVPFRPTPFRADITLTLSGADVTMNMPVQYRYEGSNLSGEKRMELTVVPRLGVTMTPGIAIVPASSTGAPNAGPTRGSRAGDPNAAAALGTEERELRVMITNHDKGRTAGQVSLSVPAGWQVAPATAAVNFTREDEAQTVRFTVRAAAGTAAGDYPVKAVATVGQQAFDRGYQVVEHPHIHRRQLEIPSVTSLKILDVRTAPNLLVGYVTGAGDEVPQAIEQLGAKVEIVGSDQLAWGDLSRYDAIVTGVRAYEPRADLRASNGRLLEYAEKGGTLIVQYNRSDRGFNEGGFTPYPVKVSTTRVTDENAPVSVLVPGHPVFSFPNRISEATWRGWVQERGTYFLDATDPRYVDLLQFNEPFENNQGWKKGALVEARVGKGRWIYVGLGLWRQVAAGTDGAYQLLANLISLGKAPAR